MVTTESVSVNVQLEAQSTRITLRGLVSILARFSLIITRMRWIKSASRTVLVARLRIGRREAVLLHWTVAMRQSLIRLPSDASHSAPKHPCTLPPHPPKYAAPYALAACSPSTTPTSASTHAQRHTTVSTQLPTSTARNTAHQPNSSSSTKHQASASASAHVPAATSSLPPVWNASNCVQKDTGATLPTINAFSIVLHCMPMTPPTCVSASVPMAPLLITPLMLAKESVNTLNLWKIKSVLLPVRLVFLPTTSPGPV